MLCIINRKGESGIMLFWGVMSLDMYDIGSVKNFVYMVCHFYIYFQYCIPVSLVTTGTPYIFDISLGDMPAYFESPFKI